MRWNWIFVVLAVVLGSANAQEKVLAEWRFERDGEDLRWKAAAQVADFKVKGGAMSGRATGNDPIIFGPVFEIPATPLACVEICMTSSERASAELFWTQTLEGKFGGFSGEKHRVFTTEGDSKEHVYRVYPFWQSVGKIVRLRVDPPNEGTFAIKWIRIVDRGGGTATQGTKWSAADWKPLGDLSEEKSGAILASGALALKAEDYSFVCVRLAATKSGTARVYAVSQSSIGWDSASFPLRADGKVHTYNVDVSGLKTWQGQVAMLGVQTPPECEAKVESIEVSRDPAGPAEVEVAYLGATEGVNRAGKPAGVTLNLRNMGGTAAEKISATLIAPAGVRIIGDATQAVDCLTIHRTRTLNWQAHAVGAGKLELSVKVEGAGIAPFTANTTIEFTPVPAIAKTDYIPEPVPVKSKYELGAFYYPGWHNSAKWEPIRPYPNRKPVLGWYDEANPECADWQIKWAVEHGIKFFMVDWYWDRGHRHNEHWIHNAFEKARFRKYLQWAVMWANHNPPDTHTEEDWRKVTQYWIDHYFAMPEYYKIDGKPAVFIWTPGNIRRDVGGIDKSVKLYEMAQEMAKAAGYKGIYFAAVNQHNTAELYGQLKREGYEGSTDYHGFELARKLAGSDRFSYDRLIETAFEVWKKEDEIAQGLSYFPIVDTGWDARPWHAEKTTVISGRTPKLFGELCRKAKAYADQTNKRIIAIGPWNEWGEGSYIEPYAEYGFGDLDALREVFCEPGNWPANVIPADVGRGGYDLPPLVAKTAWEFNTDGELEGWTGSQVAELRVKDGVLSGKTTGNDPILTITGLQVEADQLGKLKIRMKCDKPGLVQVYFATSFIKMSEQTYVPVEVKGDRQFHDYEVDLSANARWRGVITQLRIDPAIEAGIRFEVDWVRLER